MFRRLITRERRQNADKDAKVMLELRSELLVDRFLSRLPSGNGVRRWGGGGWGVGVGGGGVGCGVGS